MGHGDRVSEALSPHHLPAPPRSRLLLGLLAAALVNGGWLALLQIKRPVAPVASSRIVLRILAEKPVVPPPPPGDDEGMRVPPSNLPAVPVLPVPELTGVPASPIQQAAALPTASAAATPARPEPLKLGLSPARPASGARGESMLSQMLNDPRANSEKRSVEYAVADAAGTLPVTVSTATDGTGSKLIRQGSKCTRVTESRVSMLNPMDERARGLPSMAGACTR